MLRTVALLAGAVVMTACNDGDVVAPATPNQGVTEVCAATTISGSSANGERMCAWSIDEAGVAGQPFATDCGDMDCPGEFICQFDGTNGMWVARSLTCPNTLSSAEPPPAGATNLYAVLNGASPGDVIRFSRASSAAAQESEAFELDADFSYQSRENQGSAVDPSGHLVHVGDNPPDGPPGLITSCELAADGDAGMFDAERAHEIRMAGTDDNPGFTAPKGLNILTGQGLAVIADVGDGTAGSGSLRVFGLSAEGNQSPVATISTPANPWDSAYDSVNDRLYVAQTNGTIAQYNDAANVLRTGGVPSLAALIRVVDDGGAQLSVNLHGAVYEPTTDSLIVSDVGDASSDSDGQVFVLREISERPNDNVVPARTITGPLTTLGNPVDIVLSGRDLVIAEKANGGGQVLVYYNVFLGTESNVAPDSSFSADRPESLALEPTDLNLTGVTDISNLGIVGDFDSLLVSLAEQDTVRVQRRAFMTGAIQSEFTLDGAATENLFGQNVIVGLNGETVIVTSGQVPGEAGMIPIGDPPPPVPAGGYISASGLASLSVSRSFSASLDRRIENTAASGLTFPRGADVVPELGLLLIADTGAGDIKVVSQCGDGTILMTLDVDQNDGETDIDGPPWDLDYDPVRGDLYVAMTNGNLRVFRGVRSTLADGSAPSSFVVSLERLNGNVPEAVGTNLHGVAYVAGVDRLILSDVGDAASDSDGALYVLTSAGSLGTTARVAITVEGGDTLLGNPVDIAFDGDDLFVAEKANGGGQVLRFDNFLNVNAGDTAPDAMFSAPSIESLSLVPSYIANP